MAIGTVGGPLSWGEGSDDGGDDGGDGGGDADWDDVEFTYDQHSLLRLLSVKMMMMVTTMMTMTMPVA